MADLSTPPASDITTLARGNGGVFPRERVMNVLEGRMAVRGHEPPAMPNWSRVLKRTEGDDDRVIRKRLEALAAHVESLQVK